MMKLITNNIGLKLLALVFAIAMWLIVVNVEDPDVTRSYTVDVTEVNTDVVEDAGKIATFSEENASIRVTVTAKRSVIENLSTSDFNAYVDYQDLSDDLSDGDHSMQIYVSLNRYASQVTMDSGTKYMTVTIEDETSNKVEVKVETSGSPASGYVVGETAVSPESIKVTGAKSVVEQVSYAVVTVDVSGASEEFTQKEAIKLYDENGEEIETDNLTLSKKKVSVTVTFEQQNSVKLKFETTGTPAEGYEVAEVTANVTEISVHGDDETVEKLKTITISDIDVTDATESFTTQIALADYLPDGVTLSAGTESTITVSVKIEPYEELSVDFQTSDIVINNLSDGYTAEFSDDTIVIELMCSSEVIDSITTADLTVSCDLTDYEAGTYTVTLDVTLPDGTTLAEEATASIVIRAATEETTTEESTDETTNTTGSDATTEESTDTTGN